MRHSLLILPVLLAVLGCVALGLFAGIQTPETAASLNRSAAGHLHRFAIESDPTELACAQDAISRSLARQGAQANLGALILRGRLEIASHQFEDARETAHILIERLPGLALGGELLGSALFQLGDYAAAEQAWTQAETISGAGYLSEARWAQLEWVRGHVDTARTRLSDALKFARAIPETPEAEAWCEVQLGDLAFRTGDWAAADERYAEARRTLPEYSPALERLAELRAAQGHTAEALEIFRGLLGKAPRPDLMQALGEVLRLAGKTDESREWLRRAEAAYLLSTQRGECLYFHHLSGFYADALENPERALHWARRDAAMRGGIESADTLAWALYKTGRFDEALSEAARALSSGTRDSHLLQHAGLIHLAAGDVEGGGALLHQARESNPRHRDFHLHR